MVLSTSSIALSRNGNLVNTRAARPADEPRASARAHPRARRSASRDFLRIPPFPGAKVSAFAPAKGAGHLSAADAARVIEAIRRHRVGGSYWAAQPSLPQPYVLVRSGDGMATAEALGSPAVLSQGECDPWHMLDRAVALVAQPDDELCLIASILDVPAYSADGEALDLSAQLPGLLAAAYESPFSGEPISAIEAVELCGFWRSLIDSNRGIAGGLGFAFWKQDNVAPLLWDGTKPFAFFNSAKAVPAGQPVAVWRSKAAPEAVARLEQAGVPLIEVEDGFLRSQGLGADCVPPLSITVDRLGAYFDPAQPSELEQLLERGTFDEALLERARRLRAIIVEAGLGKYEGGGEAINRPAGSRRHILVPGQVEDDRSVMTGGGGLSNLDLLKRVRADAPDACILYKPHPDVLAGHRKGAIAERLCLQFADRIVGDAAISSLIAMVDEVHVNTSLAGFEALMRGKPVTTYGVPFYAGWGLTTDKGNVPARRTARRSIDELVAAALLLYPRYLDPVTGLPCPAEVVVDRLSARATPGAGMVVRMRRLQGKVMRRLRSVLR
jgi:capsular polysaccharide export protein